MSKRFLEMHLFTLLEEFDRSSLPLDLVINQYFRAHKALGSKDRAFLAETIFLLIRWRGRIDAQLKKESASWQERYEWITLHPDFRKIKEPKEEWDAASFPKELFDELLKSLGKERTLRFCLASNEAAPTTIRANGLKTTPDELLEKLRALNIEGERCQFAPFGITLKRRENLFSLPLFKEGLFEMQDEGSQLVAEKVEARPGEHVLDFCSGSGGKALAIAPKLQGKGQLYLHDVRKRALQEAKKRLARASIQNAQMLLSDHPHLKKMKRHMDWVLVDAPCTGTGTLRRSPDMKWRFTKEGLEELILKQRMIFETALEFVKPGGKIIFATCSVLNGENSEQVAHFLKSYPLELIEEPFLSIPEWGKMDGLFAATFQLKR